METNMWDARRMVREYVRIEWTLEREFKTLTFPNQVRTQRVAAFINACIGSSGKCDTPQDMIRRVFDFSYSNRDSLLVDSELTDEAIARFLELSYQILTYSRGFERLKSHSDFHRSRPHMLHCLLIGRIAAEKLLNVYSGVLEASAASYICIRDVNAIYFRAVEKGNEIVDTLIAILLGKRFDRTFTTDELIANYGYPTVTDDEIVDWEIDNF